MDCVLVNLVIDYITRHPKGRIVNGKEVLQDFVFLGEKRVCNFLNDIIIMQRSDFPDEQVEDILFKKIVIQETEPNIRGDLINGRGTTIEVKTTTSLQRLKSKANLTSASQKFFCDYFADSVMRFTPDGDGYFY
ncbi:hypothetical protein MUP79_10215, partial [Candidatus Bathyarchaeota archaeon]|nr:hypothetical protein [Candidatus Bathyarchaeota archaeon]